MERIYTLLIFIILQGCASDNTTTEKKYTVYTSHDNNFTTSGKYYCDSIEFKSQTEAVLWIDGRQMKIYAPLIKCFVNK